MRLLFYGIRTLPNEGEQLFIHMFHTGSKGLASVTDLRNLENRRSLGACGRDSNAGLKINEMDKRGYEESDSGGLHSPGARLHVDGIPVAMQKRFG